MDAHTRIEQLLDWLDEAKGVPFSTSVMVSRDAFADELEAMRDELPAEVREARRIIEERDEVLARANREAERIEADAQAERQRLVSQAEVYIEAERQAEDIIAEARARAHELKVEADDYVDSKLAKFEIALHKTLQTVERGRNRLAGQLGLSEDAPPRDDDAFGERPGRATRGGEILDENPQGRRGLYDHEAL